jgi:hypothetical protein
MSQDLHQMYKVVLEVDGSFCLNVQFGIVRLELKCQKSKKEKRALQVLLMPNLNIKEM